MDKKIQVQEIWILVCSRKNLFYMIEYVCMYVFIHKYMNKPGTKA